MKPFYRFEFRRVTLLCIGCVGLMAGLYVVWMGYSFSLPFFTSFLLAPFVMKRKLAACIAIFLICFTVGMWRGSTTFAQLQRYESLYNQWGTVAGTVSDDASFNAQRSQTEFHITHINVGGKSLPGRVKLATHESVTVTRGDSIRAQGKLRATKGTSRQGILSANEVVIVTKNNSWLEQLRAHFFAAVKSVLPEPYGSLGLGYLVGIKADIPQRLQEQLSLTGLTHIVAVSGYNLTIIVEVVRKILGKRSAYQSVVGTLSLLVSFIAITGGSPSINRAAIICLLSLLAWYYGREFKPILLLLLSGALTALWSPLYIWGDPGWYLSFLAFAGVLLLAPLITAVLFRARQPSLPEGVLIETLSAQVCTTPYVMYLFGTVSIIAPVANVLVLPFIPVIMLLVLVTGLTTMALPFIGQLVATIPRALLTFQIWVIERLSGVTFAQIKLHITIWHMYALFTVLVLVILGLHYLRKKQLKKPALTEADNLVQLIEQL